MMFRSDLYKNYDGLIEFWDLQPILVRRSANRRCVASDFAHITKIFVSTGNPSLNQQCTLQNRCAQISNKTTDAEATQRRTIPMPIFKFSSYSLAFVLR